MLVNKENRCKSKKVYYITSKSNCIWCLFSEYTHLSCNTVSIFCYSFGSWWTILSSKKSLLVSFWLILGFFLCRFYRICSIVMLIKTRCKHKHWPQLLWTDFSQSIDLQEKIVCYYFRCPKYIFHFPSKIRTASTDIHRLQPVISSLYFSRILAVPNSCMMVGIQIFISGSDFIGCLSDQGVRMIKT